MDLKDVVDKVVFDEKTIQKAVKELGRRISEDYRGKPLLLVGILRGAYVFLSDLSRHIDTPHMIDFMGVSSYGASTVSTGIVRIEADLRQSVEGKHVLVVEDIVDTGTTFSQLRKVLDARRPSSVKICALLDKPGHRKVKLVPDYTGLTAPDLFLAGYGLDYAEYFRGVPYIFSVKSTAPGMAVGEGL